MPSIQAAAAVAAVLLACPLAAQVVVEVEGYAQLQFNTTSVDDAEAGEEIAASTFETRRIRPTVTVTIDDWISGTVQPDFALGRMSLKDAFMNFAVADGFELRVGQFKKPFSRLELVSSSKILPIEREVRIRGLEDVIGGFAAAEEQAILDAFGYKGRDIGLAAHGTLGSASYELGVFNGAGADRRDDNDGKSAAGRVQVKPSAAIPLSLGAAASYRELGTGPAPVSGTAWELSAEWGELRRPGVHVLAEAVTGENLALDDRTFRGAQAWLAYFAPVADRRVQGVEPVVRVSFGDPVTDVADSDGWLLTPGLNVYFHGRNRVMLNWDVFVPAGDLDTASALRAQAQLHF